MSIKKMALSFAFAGILGATAAVAEESGGFIGLQGNTSFQGDTRKVEYRATGGTTNSTKTETSSYQFGFLAGYKQFFVPKFGLRYYGVLNYQSSEASGTTNSRLGFNANIDALFNFISDDSFDLGGFGGLSFGYVSTETDTGTTASTLDGIDFGLNVGLRVNVAKHHGLEFYTRIGLIGQKQEDTAGNLTVTTRNKQDYIGGLRYTFSF